MTSGHPSRAILCRSLEMMMSSHGYQCKEAWLKRVVYLPSAGIKQPDYAPSPVRLWRLLKSTSGLARYY